MVKAVAFYGNSIGDTQYQDSEDIDGTLSEQFQRSFAFIKRNLHHVQNGRGFNTLGELEVPPIALEELLVNALMHRDYFDSASIRILVFRDRIEIDQPRPPARQPEHRGIQHGKTKRRNPDLERARRPPAARSGAGQRHSPGASKPGRRLSCKTTGSGN